MSCFNDQDPLKTYDEQWSLHESPLQASQTGEPFVPQHTATQHPRGIQAQIGLTLAVVLLIGALVSALLISNQTKVQTSTLRPTVTTATFLSPTATPTAIAVPNPFSGKLALNDSLRINQHAWCHDVYSKEWSFGNGALQISNIGAVGPSYVPCFPKGISYSDFAYQVEMTITKADRGADGGGIIFRATGPTLGGFDQFYYFRVGPDGSYDLNTSDGEAPDVDLRHGFSPAIPTGLNQMILIGVAAVGSKLDFFINSQFVLEVVDTTYTHGSIGLLAYDSGHPMNEANPPVQVQFRNIKVWLPNAE